MKKIIALIICTFMVMSVLVACGANNEPAAKKDETEENAEEVNTLMPTKLTFGLTYDEAKEKNENIPELKNATSNDGYFCSIEYVDGSVLNDFYSIEPVYIFGNTGFAYSFNESKQMYEMYIMAELSSQKDAESIFNTVKKYYDKETGVEGTVKEKENGLEAIWVTEENGINLSVYEDDGNIKFSYTIHNFEYELS